VDLAWISLAALVVTIVVSCTTEVNPGLLAVVFAWVIGVYAGPSPIGLKSVLGGFPTELFLTLVGVTLLFAQAQDNGTLEAVARAAVRGCRGNVGLIPLAFFGLALTVASIGAGNIAAAALVAPLAMAVAGRAGISPFLMTLTVAHGSVAGALSPFAPTGIIADGLMDRLGLSGHAWRIYVANAVANAAVAIAGYLLFGGWRLFGRKYDDGAAGADPGQELDPKFNAKSKEPFGPRHAMTLALIVCLIVAVVGFQVHVGMGAMVIAIVLTFSGLADEKRPLKAMPWSVIVMVCGVTVLTSLLEKTGGIDRFTTIIARISTERTITGVIAFVTGLVSVYSSTSGVVLPAFLPTVPGLVQKLGGGDPLGIALSILIGGHLVDVSPLSTIGALCVACAPPETDRRSLFNRVLGWGLFMAIVGAIGCFLVFGRD
jgi:Na+/H+ antiporter NhaD/arsenite permease-like protein